MPNNNNARTRKSIELQITILHDDQLEPVKRQVAQAVVHDSTALAEEHPAVEDLLERSFLAHNLDKCRDGASLPASFVADTTRQSFSSKNSVIISGDRLPRHAPEGQLCVMLDFSVSFYAIASLRFLQAERFPKLGVQCLFGEHQTRIPFLSVATSTNICVARRNFRK